MMSLRVSIVSSMTGEHWNRRIGHCNSTGCSRRGCVPDVIRTKTFKDQRWWSFSNSSGPRGVCRRRFGRVFHHGVGNQLTTTVHKRGFCLD